LRYVLDEEKVKAFIKEVKPSKVLVEAPPGLFKPAKRVCELVSVECEISAMPVFGGCLAYEFLEGDAIIHLGHNPYPWWTPKKPTLYLEVPVEVETDVEVVKDKLKGKRVVLGAVVQHLNLLDELKERLRGWGFEPLTFTSKGLKEGQVLGCDYRNLRRGYDDYLIVAGGRFHALGAALYLKRDVLAFDPYSSRVERLDPTKALARRMWLVKEASNTKTVALVDGHEGQARPGLVRALKEMAEKAGMRVRVYKSLILTREFVLNLPEEVVVTLSCPRLALDDFGDVREKVVLAPGEFRAAVLGLDSYAFPF